MYAAHDVAFVPRKESQLAASSWMLTAWGKLLHHELQGMNGWLLLS
jgi:hypothetical protein